MTSIPRWDGRAIPGVASTGSGVFAALDWIDMIYGSPGPAIEQKASCASRQLRSFRENDRPALTRVLGHYSNVQSSNSEDTVTWSVFGGAEKSRWINTVLECAFSQAELPSKWNLEFWERTPHHDTGVRLYGPEADLQISAPGWYYVIEAKWCKDLDDNQGKNRDMTQADEEPASGGRERRTQKIRRTCDCSGARAIQAFSIEAEHFQPVLHC